MRLLGEGLKARGDGYENSVVNDHAVSCIGTSLTSWAR